MALFKRMSLVVITLVMVLTLLGGCGLFFGGPRDGKGPRRDGSGNGPCRLFSYQLNSEVNAPLLHQKDVDLLLANANQSIGRG